MTLTTGYSPGTGCQQRLLPDQRELEERFRHRYGDLSARGWQVKMRHRFGYHSPEAWYEALVDRLVAEGTSWIDVGGGNSVLPHNTSLAASLSRRCGLLVGVDPSDRIDENPFVHQRAKCTIEQFASEHSFDLATLRMVAEHVREPEAAVASLARLIKPGGKVVVYTPNRWSPASLAAALVPHRWHHRMVRLLWRTEEEDHFPTAYKMNTRGRLRALFESGGFREVAFAYVDSCFGFRRIPVACFLELSLWKTLRTIGLKYPENNLLGVYQRT